MAVTKLLRIKESPGKYKDTYLRRNLFYICKKEKTDGGRNIGGSAGTTPESALLTMQMNKQLWGKTDGTQGFHYILSFDPSVPVPVERIHRIAQEFCSELFADRYYYLYAIHDDRKHQHVHITFDSVSHVDGRKFHSPQGDWERRIQPITDALCERYSLPKLTWSPERRGVCYGEWKHRKETEEGKVRTSYTWHDVIRDDIDEAVGRCESYEQLLEVLRDMKYTVRDGKYLSLCPYGKEKAVRTGRLGKGYAKEEILLRIRSRPLLEGAGLAWKTYGDEKEIRKILSLKVMHARGWHLSEYQKRFYQRWRRTYLIRRPNLADAWKYKRDIIELNHISEALKFLVETDIRDEASLRSYKENLEEERSALTAQRKAVSSQIYQNTLMKDLSRFQRLSAALQDLGTDEREELELLRDRIEQCMPLEKAAERLKELKDERSRINALLKQNRRMVKLVGFTDRLSHDPIHPTDREHKKEIRQGHENVREEGMASHESRMQGRNIEKLTKEERAYEG